ncbi:PH domain-containing protein [Saccharothrix violaceirubra]
MGRELGPVSSVVRRRSEVIFGCVAAVGTVAGTLYLLLDPPAGAGFGDQVRFVSVMTLFLWFILLVGPHPRIEIRERGLVVVNWLSRTSIPWTAVESVEADGALELRLRDGRVHRPIIASRSLATVLSGDRLQNEMKAAVVNAESAVPDGDSRARTRPDLWLGPLVLVYGTFLLIGWLAAR